MPRARSGPKGIRNGRRSPCRSRERRPRGVPPVLERFRDIVGAGRITGPRIVPSPWSKLPQYRWELRQFAQIERVVALLRPYADIVKRSQMEVCVRAVRVSRARRTAG